MKLEDVPSPRFPAASATAISAGQSIPAHQRVLIYSPDEWEIFIQEWVHYKKTQYRQVLRMAGAGDLGVDIAAFTDEKGLFGIWDNYQCKHYDAPLAPTTAWIEIGKVLWYSYRNEYSPPRAFYFVAPKDCGPKLSRLLKAPEKLRDSLKSCWEKTCSEAITKAKTISLEGEFLNYVNDFDFSVFSLRTTLEVIDEHRATPYHVVRFGGGLADRPATEPPPETPTDEESRYIRQLFEAYGDNKKVKISSRGCLAPWEDLESHYDRQREAFYEAEALRNFARDNVPPGTFESLQEEMYDGVIEVESMHHSDGYVRMNQVLTTASQVNPTANGLISVVKVKDKKGICHQLANVDRLRWKK